jgi:thiamine kinase-like enzyme
MRVRSGSTGSRAPRTAASLTDAEIRAVLEQVPELAGHVATFERVPGGLTNVNVRVHLPDGDAIARLTTDDSALLAIDRPAEYESSLAAAASGAAPPVVGYSPEAGVLAVRWIDGGTCTPEALRKPDLLARVVRTCRRLHAGPRFTVDFDMFAVQRRYLGVVREHGFRLPAGYLDHMPAFGQVEAALRGRAEPTVPCHNDLLPGNLVDDGERIWLIDYEYAGNNDPCFELGNLWSEANLPPEALETLVTGYYGRAWRHKVARARLFGLASKYGWTPWAAIQDRASSIDADFWAWGMDKYDRAVAEFVDPGLPALLEEAMRPD